MQNDQNRKILLVDDDPIIHQAMMVLLGRKGVKVESAYSLNSAKFLLSKSGPEYPVIIIDYHLPDGKGANLKEFVREINPDAYVLIYTGDTSQEVMKNVIRGGGADDFIEKGGDAERILATIESYLEKASKENHSQGSSEHSLADNVKVIESVGLAGRSDALASVVRQAKKNQAHRYTTLILGETGVGKEVVAKALHQGSADKFFAVNCAAYKDSTNLMQSELFGHERGAFTGADRLKQGIFELARGGTVFLDELHELSLSAQNKLLRALAERSFRREGGAVEIPFDAKIICGAKPDIEERVQKGEFLLDLYKRVDVIRMEIPPLRDRKQDIEPLIDHFSKLHGKNLGREIGFEKNAVQILEKHRWTGNVRELENVVIKLLINAEGKAVTAADVRKLPEFHAGMESGQELQSAESLTDLRSSFESQERVLIMKAFRESGGQLRKSARRLGVSHTALLAKMRKYGLASDKKEESTSA